MKSSSFYETFLADPYTLTGRPAVSVYPSVRFSHMALVSESASFNTSACQQDRTDMVWKRCGRGVGCGRGSSITALQVADGQSSPAAGLEARTSCQGAPHLEELCFAYHCKRLAVRAAHEVGRGKLVLGEKALQLEGWQVRRLLLVLPAPVSTKYVAHGCWDCSNGSCCACQASYLWQSAGTRAGTRAGRKSWDGISSMW